MKTLIEYGHINHLFKFASKITINSVLTDRERFGLARFSGFTLVMTETEGII